MGLASSQYASGDRLIYEAALGPDTKPMFPDAMDDEFDDGSFDTGLWSWLDQGGATAAESDDMLVLTLNENANRIRGITQAAPTAPWEFRAKLHIPDMDTVAAASYICLFAAENGTGDVRSVGIYGGREGRGLSFTTPSSALSSWGDIYGTSPNSAAILFKSIYAQLAYDGNDIIASLSVDGVGFVEIEGLTLGYTPTLIGLGITNAKNTEIHYPFGWFRRTV